MILALDIATTTGWAVGEPGARPTSGSIRLKADGIGGKMHVLHRHLTKMVCEYDPDLIIFEQPIHAVIRRGSSNVLRLANALCGAAEMVAYERGVEVREVPIPTWRKHFIGYGRAPKGRNAKWLKQQAQVRCRHLGWGDLSEDAAEATGVWDYACSLRSHSHAVRTAGGLMS